MATSPTNTQKKTSISLGSYRQNNSIILSGKNLGSEGYKQIIAEINESTQTLIIDSNKLGSKECQEIINALKEKNSPLQTLNLANNHIGSEGCKAIFEFLRVKKIKNLQSLNLSHNGIDVQGSRYLCGILQLDFDLKTLSLAGNKLGNEGCEYLREGIKVNQTLEALNLEDNKIDPLGWKFISEALLVNNSIQKLNCSKNSIKDEGCIYLSDVLKKNISLQFIILQDGDIGEDGFKFLSEGLQRNNTLQALDIQKNRIQSKGYQHLIEIFNVNLTLCELKVDKSEDISNLGFLVAIEKRTEANSQRIMHIRKLTDQTWEELMQRAPNLKGLIIEACSLKEMKIDLNTFKNLILLDLRNNELNNESVQAICNFVKWNPTLQTLILLGNKTIRNQEGELLLSAISLNTCLVQCNLCGTSVLPLLQEKIKNQIKQNYPLSQTLLYKICLQHSLESELIIKNKRDELMKILNKNQNLKLLQDLLFVCCAWNRIDPSILILDQDININSRLEDGNTYLHICVMKDNYEIAKLLLEKGIDLNILNNEGKSCKDVAVGKCKTLFEGIKQLKVVVLGKGEVGKTTLIKKILFGNELKSRLKETFKKNKRTDGIEMHEWFTEYNNIIQLWDFGGQELFYTTHQFFLSKSSIHLLLFDLTDLQKETEIYFWLNSIQYRAPGSKVILIGNFMDKLDGKLMEQEFIMTSSKINVIFSKVISSITQKSDKIEIIPCSSWRNPKLKEDDSNSKLLFYPISGKEGWNIETLKNVITGLSFNTVVRKEFYDLTKEIIIERQNKMNSGKHPILFRGEIKSIISKYFNSNEEIEKNLKQLHELGFILDFGMFNIIIYPQWLSSVFKSVVSLNNSEQIKDGLISKSNIVSNLKKVLENENKKKLEKTNKKKETIEFDDIITQRESPLVRNSLSKSRKRFSLKSDSEENRDLIYFGFLLELMEKFQVCIPKPENEASEKTNYNERDLMMVIPCLLSKNRIPEVDSIFGSQTEDILGRKYLFPFIPRGIFENLFAKVASFLGSNIKFWRNGFMIVANEGKGYLMFEIKSSEEQLENVPASSPPISSTKNRMENLYKGSSIEIKSTGNLSHYLISAFHFCIKELLERDYPLLWNNVKIFVEYYYGEGMFSESLINSLKAWKTNRETLNKTTNGIPIPWLKLIPEQYDNDDDIHKLIVDSAKFIPGRKLGEGAYAEVFICKASNHAGSFAIKKFKRELNPEKGIKITKSFQRELDIMQKLNHPNISKLIGFNQKGDNWLLIFPLYDNSLEGIHEIIFKFVLRPKGLTKYPLENKEVEEKYWWKPQEIIFFALEILNGLKYLHSNFIAHLDLKGENILVYFNKDENDTVQLLPSEFQIDQTKDGEPKRFSIKSLHIHDFGTSIKFDSNQGKLEHSEFIGSSFHMAPEIRRLSPDKEGKIKSELSYDPFKADIFSFGILLCEIVANNYKLYNDKKLDKLNKNRFGKIILECLKEDPNERPRIDDLITYFENMKKELNDNY